MTGESSTAFKRFLLIVIAGLAVLPAIQKGFRPFHSRGLDGYSAPNPFPAFSTDSLFNGSWLPAVTRHFDRGTGFHNDLVRLRNQVDFSLFRIIHAQKVVMGKDQYLFEESYLDAFAGKDFIGERIIDARVRQFRYAQDRLWKEKSILFLVLLLPDKGTFYPGFVPDKYRRGEGIVTNYERYRDKLGECGVNHIDFNAWFLRLKDTCRYPLYPKTGIHWSQYGAFLAFDSLTRYLSGVTGHDLPQARISRWRISHQAEGRDNDVERACNLLCPIDAPPLAYPGVTFTAPAGARPFSALFIGDSFYFAWAEGGYIGKVFANSDFWYYDHDVYSGTHFTGKQAAAEPLQQWLDRVNAIIIMQTNAGNGELGYYFLDRLFKTTGI